MTINTPPYVTDSSFVHSSRPNLKQGLLYAQHHPAWKVPQVFSLDTKHQHQEWRGLWQTKQIWAGSGSVLPVCLCRPQHRQVMRQMWGAVVEENHKTEDMCRERLMSSSPKYKPRVCIIHGWYPNYSVSAISVGISSNTPPSPQC
jgi:hypothetical protein